MALNTACELRSRGLLSQSEQAYLQAVAVDQSCAPARTELITLYNSIGMLDKGLEQAQKAAVSSPNDPAVRINLAVEYMNLNRNSDAAVELGKAAGNDPGGRARELLMELFQRTGKDTQSGQP